MRSTKLEDVAWTPAHKLPAVAGMKSRCCSDQTRRRERRGRLGADRVVGAVVLGADDDDRDDPGSCGRTKKIDKHRRALRLICSRACGAESISDVNCGGVRLRCRHACHQHQACNRCGENLLHSISPAPTATSKSPLNDGLK